MPDTTDPQTEARARITAALRSITVIGGTPPTQLVPVIDSSSPRMARIADWQPLGGLVDALLAATTPVAAPPTGQAGLREQVAAALYRHEWPRKQVWQQALAMDREVFLAQADAVLSVLPSAADRAAVLREAATIVRSMDSDYALQEAAEHLDGLAVEADEEREAQAHLDALVPIAEGAPLPDLDGPALYEKLTAMFSGPLPWPSDIRPDLVTLRERIAEDLYAHDHPGWRVPMVDSDTEPVYRERAVAVLDGLRRLAAETPGPETQGVQHAPGTAILCPDCHAKGHSVCMGDEVIHACPPDGSGLTPCCGRTPFELPRTDRMSTSPALVTCTLPAVVAEPGKEG